MNKFKINDVAYDRYAKEFVKITNGTDTDGFVPTEAIAVRFAGVTKAIGTKKGSEHSVPQIGFTYRKVEEMHLEKVDHAGMFDLLGEILSSRYNIGRI